jgi:hypothetical protein
MFPAIAATTAAIFELAACILTARNSSFGLLAVVLLAEMIIIAAALTQWVVYFRRYIAQQIEERLQKTRTNSGDISN